MIFALTIAIVAWGVFDIRLGFFIKTHCSGQKNERKIALTFDDGPTEFTPSLLKILTQYNAKATFFCIGKQIEKYPETLLSIVENGHLVGNHTYSHSNTIGFFSSDKITKEILRTQNIIFQLIGKKTKLFRPPFGITNPHIAKTVHSLGYQVIGWNIRSLDTIINDEERLFRRIKKRICNGGILLMHDTSEKSIRVLERLLIFLKTEKYEVVPLDELLKIPSYET